MWMHTLVLIAQTKSYRLHGMAITSLRFCSEIFEPAEETALISLRIGEPPFIVKSIDSVHTILVPCQEPDIIGVLKLLAMMHQSSQFHKFEKELPAYISLGETIVYESMYTESCNEAHPFPSLKEHEESERHEMKAAWLSLEVNTRKAAASSCRPETAPPLNCHISSHISKSLSTYAWHLQNRTSPNKRVER